MALKEMLKERTSMGPLRQTTEIHQPIYPEPAPADYSDEVTDRDLAALSALVQAELDGEEWEVIDGPGW